MRRLVMIVSLTLVATMVVVGAVYASHTSWSWFVPGSDVEFLGIQSKHVRIDVVKDGNMDAEVILGVLPAEARVATVVTGTTTASAEVEILRVNGSVNDDANTRIVSSSGAKVITTFEGNVIFELGN